MTECVSDRSNKYVNIYLTSVKRSTKVVANLFAEVIVILVDTNG